MAYPICKVKNISGVEHTRKGKTFNVSELWTITDEIRISWATDDDVGDDINADDLQMYDASGAIDGHMAQIAHLQDY